MGVDFFSKIQADASQLTSDQLRYALGIAKDNFRVPPQEADDFMAFDLGIADLVITYPAFDRLVLRRVFGLVPWSPTEDPELLRLGLVEAQDKAGDSYYISATYGTVTNQQSFDVSITHLGHVVLALATPMLVISSLIRQALYSILEMVVPELAPCYLPELLSHENPIVRDIVAKYAVIPEDE